MVYGANRSLRMLTPEELRPFLQFTLRAVGPASLRELLESLTGFFPDLKPATVHDGLNCLLSEGLIVLSKTGVYFDSSHVPNTPAQARSEAPL